MACPKEANDTMTAPNGSPLTTNLSHKRDTSVTYMNQTCGGGSPEGINGHMALVMLYWKRRTVFRTIL